jgi:hypothetical protein
VDLVEALQRVLDLCDSGLDVLVAGREVVDGLLGVRLDRRSSMVPACSFDSSASDLISSATTANPRPASPALAASMEALNAGDATMGESRLFEREGAWYRHVTATRDVEERSEVSAEERTPIGVDIGEASLVTVCHRDDHGSPTAPELWADEGKTVRRLRRTYFTAKRRLQTRGSETYRRVVR